LRKIYDNSGYKTLADTTKVQQAAWMAMYMGWSLSSGLSTSVSYSDVEVVMIPPKLKELDAGTKAIHNFVAAATPTPEPALGSVDIQSNNWRDSVKAGKKRQMEFIELTNDKKKQRISYNVARKSISKEQRVENAKGVVARLRTLGVDTVTQNMVMAFGFGRMYAKVALV
jgi:hypothetical protein